MATMYTIGAFLFDRFKVHTMFTKSARFWQVQAVPKVREFLGKGKLNIRLEAEFLEFLESVKKQFSACVFDNVEDVMYMLNIIIIHVCTELNGNMFPKISYGCHAIHN